MWSKNFLLNLSSITSLTLIIEKMRANGERQIQVVLAFQLPICWINHKIIYFSESKSVCTQQKPHNLHGLAPWRKALRNFFFFWKIWCKNIANSQHEKLPSRSNLIRYYYDLWWYAMGEDCDWELLKDLKKFINWSASFKSLFSIFQPSGWRCLIPTNPKVLRCWWRMSRSEVFSQTKI